MTDYSDVPVPGDVIRIYAQEPPDVQVSDVAKFEPGYWKITGHRLTGSRFGRDGVWHLYREEFEYLERVEA